MQVNNVLRTSEFWVGVATVIGQLLAAFGVIDAVTWQNVFWPAVIYVVGRATSKAVKAAPTKEKPNA
jgi:hypothetical protein